MFQEKAPFIARAVKKKEQYEKSISTYNKKLVNTLLSFLLVCLLLLLIYSNWVGLANNCCYFKKNIEFTNAVVVKTMVVFDISLQLLTNNYDGMSNNTTVFTTTAMVWLFFFFAIFCPLSVHFHRGYTIVVVVSVFFTTVISIAVPEPWL